MFKSYADHSGRERIAREDSHYKRNGTQKLHVTTEPLDGWRHVEVTAKRRKREFVELMQELADVHYPEAAASG